MMLSAFVSIEKESSSYGSHFDIHGPLQEKVCCS